MNDNKNIIWRAYLIYFGFVAIMLLVIYKTYVIQHNEDVKSTDVTGVTTRKLPTRIVARTSRRGEVLDINRTPLVTSVSFYDIYMDPTVCKEEIFDNDIMELTQELHKLFPDVSASEYERFIRRGRASGRRYLLIKRKATNEERNKLKNFPIFKLGKNKGGLIDNVETVIRKRPHGELLKRTLGYYQKDNKGELRVGIEGAFHEYLVGEPGAEIEQRISTGWKKTGKILKDAVEGADVVTTFDKTIQEVAHNELLHQLKQTNGTNGCVVVMDVKTGYVKAMVNLSKGEDGEYYESYNQAIGSKEVPGSTFKLASLMAALEDKKINIRDTVDCATKYTYFGRSLNEAHNNYYGRITIKRAFELSSNVISKIIYKAYRDEPETFINRLKSFGLGEPLGVDILGEPNPTLYEPGSKNWSGLSLPWTSVGYEVQQTPLQTLAFYNAVANKGKMVRPQFVKEIVRGSEVVKYFKPVVLREKICSDKTLKILQSCLVGVMKDGTGKRLTSSYFDIAGKTGTAEILNANMRYGPKGQKKYLASFVGYFPVKTPMYSCIVAISAAGEHVYGATVSGTVFAAIANKVYAGSLKYHKAINETKKQVYDAPFTKDGNSFDLQKILKHYGIKYVKETSDEWVSTNANKTKVELEKRTFRKNVVPNVIGMSAKDAVFLIENAGMNARVMGYGTVKKQTVPAGTPIFRGGLIELTLE